MVRDTYLTKRSAEAISLLDKFLQKYPDKKREAGTYLNLPPHSLTSWLKRVSRTAADLHEILLVEGYLREMGQMSPFRQTDDLLQAMERGIAERSYSFEELAQAIGVQHEVPKRWIRNRQVSSLIPVQMRLRYFLFQHGLVPDDGLKHLQPEVRELFKLICTNQVDIHSLPAVLGIKQGSLVRILRGDHKPASRVLSRIKEVITKASVKDQNQVVADRSVEQPESQTRPITYQENGYVQEDILFHGKMMLGALTYMMQTCPNDVEAVFLKLRRRHSDLFLDLENALVATRDPDALKAWRKEAR